MLITLALGAGLRLPDGNHSESAVCRIAYRGGAHRVRRSCVWHVQARRNGGGRVFEGVVEISGLTLITTAGLFAGGQWLQRRGERTGTVQREQRPLRLYNTSTPACCPCSPAVTGAPDAAIVRSPAASAMLCAGEYGQQLPCSQRWDAAKSASSDKRLSVLVPECELSLAPPPPSPASCSATVETPTSSQAAEHVSDTAAIAGTACSATSMRLPLTQSREFDSGSGILG